MPSGTTYSTILNSLDWAAKAYCDLMCAGLTGSGGSGSGTGSTVIFGTITAVSFAGTPLSYTVTTVPSLSNYIVSIDSQEARIWTITNKTPTTFIVNSNSSD